MHSAIRVDKQHVFMDPDVDYHFNAIRVYQKQTGLTDDQIDEMIEAGRIEFGLASSANNFTTVGRENYVSLEAIEAEL